MFSYPFRSLLSAVICGVSALWISTRRMAGATPWALVVLCSGLSIQQLANGLAVTAHTPASLVGARQLSWAGELVMLVSQGLFGLTFARSPLRELLRQRLGVLSAFGLIVLLCAGLAIHPELGASIAPGPDRTPILTFTETGRFYAAVYLVGQVWLLTVLEYILRYADERARWYMKLPIVGVGLLCVYSVYEMADRLFSSVWRLELAGVSAVVSMCVAAFLLYGVVRRPLPQRQIYTSPKLATGSVALS